MKVKYILNNAIMDSAAFKSLSKFYFNSNSEGVFIGVNVCLTDETIQDARNKLITLNDIKKLCNSFLKQLCKN